MPLGRLSTLDQILFLSCPGFSRQRINATRVSKQSERAVHFDCQNVQSFKSSTDVNVQLTISSNSDAIRSKESLKADNMVLPDLHCLGGEQEQI